MLVLLLITGCMWQQSWWWMKPRNIYVYVCLYVTMHVDVYVPIPRAKNASFCSSLTRCLLLTCSMSYISNDVCVPSLYMYGVCMRGKCLQRGEIRMCLSPLLEKLRYWVKVLSRLCLQRKHNLTSFIIPKYLEDLPSPSWTHPSPLLKYVCSLVNIIK